MRTLGRSTLVALCGAFLAPSWALDRPFSYPAAYQDLVTAATREGTVDVVSSTSKRLAQFLINDFETLYPGVKVSYTALPPTAIEARMRQQGAAADVVWSIDMDRQMKSVMAGGALRYRSPEAAALPAWAKWNDQIYGTTYEPLVTVYNRRFIKQADVPTTRDALGRMLRAHPDAYRNKLVTYALDNPEVGALPLRLDAAFNARFWDLADALRSTGLETLSTTDGIMDRVTSGQALIGYDVVGSEAIKRAKRDPSIGVQFMLDYTWIISRVTFIRKQAAHPNAAKLWLDYVLSQRGQQQMAIADLYPIRDDVTRTEAGIEVLRKVLGVARPVALNAKLASIAEPARMDAFQTRWQAMPPLAASSRP